MATRAEAMQISEQMLSGVRRRLEAAGYKCTSQKGGIRGVLIDGGVFKVAHFALLDYAPSWMIQVVFGVNWRDVYAYTYVSRPDSSPQDWRKVSSIGFGTPHMGGRLDSELTFRSVRELPRVSSCVEALLDRVGLPFFEKWENYRSQANEFYNITQDAQKVCVLPQGLSEIAIAIALLEKKSLRQLVPAHRQWLSGFDPIALETFNHFLVQWNINIDA